jgi:hypothetical protein
LCSGYEIVHYLLLASWTGRVVELCWQQQEDQEVAYKPLSTQEQEDHKEEEEEGEEEEVESLLLHNLPFKS